MGNDGRERKLSGGAAEARLRSGFVPFRKGQTSAFLGSSLMGILKEETRGYAAGMSALGIELAADNPEALTVVKRQVTDAGYEPVVVGGLSTAKKFDQGASVYPKAMLASDMRAALGLK
jgi:hypothetical protein